MQELMTYSHTLLCLSTVRLVTYQTFVIFEPSIAQIFFLEGSVVTRIEAIILLPHLLGT